MTLNVPAHIAARVAARKTQPSNKSAVASAILGEGGGFNYPRISIRAGRYRLVEDGVETPVGITLDVIVIGANPRTSKVFYSKPYDGSTDVRPDCYSNDGVKPDARVANPVNASCADCPHNVLGSKILPSGAKSKLCSDQRHLAVVPAADPAKVYALTIPVSGMKSLRDYFRDLQNYGVNPEEVITELSFDETASYPKVVFKHKGFVPEKAIVRVEEMSQSDAVKIAVRLMDPPDNAPALAAPEPQAQIAAPAAEKPAAPKPAKAAKPAAEKPAEPEESPAVPPSAKSELESKLDSLFS